jgi:hypothetical protein
MVSYNKTPPVKLVLSLEEYYDIVYGDDLSMPGHQKFRDMLFKARNTELIITVAPPEEG